MKKTILTAMLFFAFLVVGIQSATAQYVNTDDATLLLETEIAEVLQNPVYQGADKDAQTPYLENKLNLFTFVKDRIDAGSSVGAAIELGVMTQPSTASNAGTWVAAKQNSKNPQLTVLHQELEDLLGQ